MEKKVKFQAKSDLFLLPRLVNLGLSKQEALVYLVLLNEGALPAKEIASKIDVLPHSIYRTAKNLEQKNLVGVLKTSPLTFQAISPQLAFTSFIKERTIGLQKEADKLSHLLSQKKSIHHPTQIDFVFGKHEIYISSREKVNKTKKELLIISIGEPIPQDLMLAIRNAIKRGVVIRMIVHKYDAKNKAILDNFIKNGYEIRHYPDWGFHLIVYDGKSSLLIVNDPKDTKERVGMQIFSEGLSKAFRDYFYSTWNKAVEIK